ncbi:MAG: hypothetical protein ACE5GX_03695 [Thermoanaerobaculia bacterium]
MRRLTPASALKRLEQLKLVYGPDSEIGKRDLLEPLRDAELDTVSQVVRLHETLCFLRAYPDGPELLKRVEEMLEGFDRRPDLLWFRDELDSSGISGTTISYSFFWFTAVWLARRWPELFHVEWELFENQVLLSARLMALMPYSETLALEEVWLEAPDWVERLKSATETDATFLTRRFGALPFDDFWKEQVFEELDLPCRLDPGPTTPSRSRARYEPSPVVFQTGPLETSRGCFPGALRRPPRAVRRAAPRDADRLISLAREAMVCRARDLDVFIHAERRDVHIMDCGRGLQYVCYGAIPERRQMLDAVYGFLILKNGVPIGYFLTSALYRSALVAFNVFETYRGAEAAYVYGRGLAMVRHMFGADSFGIETYQLGHNNKEALASGAWWFYYKLGFRPRDPETLAIVSDEVRKIRENPSHRSSIATLARLAEVEMYLHLGRERDDIVGLISREAIGFRLSRFLAERFGADRERGVRVCAGEAARRLGVRSRSRFSAGERLAWNRWAPLVLILPRVERWSESSRADLVEVIRSKGSARESEFVARFDRHRTLRRAILELAQETG